MKNNASDIRLTYTARQVDGGWMKTAAEVLLPDASVAKLSSDFWSRCNTIQLANDPWIVSWTSLARDNVPLAKFSINHGLFPTPNVVIMKLDTNERFVLRRRYVWSWTIDAYCQHELVGTIKTMRDLLRNRYIAEFAPRVSAEIVLLAFWCILIRGAFNARSSVYVDGG